MRIKNRPLVRQRAIARRLYMMRNRDYNGFTVSWQTHYDAREPKCDKDEIKDRIRELRWELNIDHDSSYTLEELEELKLEMENDERR